MKKIKLLVGCALIILGFIIIGESHHFYLENFTNSLPSTTLYLQNGIGEDEMKSDVLSSAENHNTGIFVIDTIVKSTFEKTINIYINSDYVRQYIEEELGINEKTYNSIFSGIVNVKFYNYENMLNTKDNHTYYVIGSVENIKTFKMDLINKYAGNHPYMGTDNYETQVMVIFVWFMVYILLLILTVYDMLFQKKEIFIRSVYGERISILILKNILIDSLFYSCFFGICFLTLKKFTFVCFHINITIIASIVFIILNTLIYLRLLVFKPRQALSSNGFSENILFSSYLIKAVTVVITILIIASNMLMIKNAVIYATQGKFFREHSQYYYVNIGYKPTYKEGIADARLEETSLLREKLYQEYFDVFSPIILVNLGQIDGHDVILANINAKEYLYSVLPQIEGKINNKNYYYIIPQKIKNYDLACDAISGQMTNYEEKELLLDYEVIEYTGNKKILNIDEMATNGSKFSDSPIIILNNMEPAWDETSIKAYPFKNNFEHDIMFKLDLQLFEQFVKDNDLQNHFHSVTNVLKKYDYNWLVLKRILYICLTFNVLILLLEIIIIRTIINLEYKVNAMELAMKKILGYGLVERHKRIIKISTIGCLISTITGIVICFVWGEKVWSYVILGGFVIWCIEIITILTEIDKVEKSNISRILKGEYL